MMLAKPGDAPVLNMQPRRFFQQAMLITLLNPKAIVFYMAFFPLFVDPARHQGLLTFGVMAATIAVLTFLYCVIVIAITHFAADRMRASPRVSVVAQPDRRHDAGRLRREARRRKVNAVIPAKAGIPFRKLETGVPAFAGTTTLLSTSSSAFPRRGAARRHRPSSPASP